MSISNQAEESNPEQSPEQIIDKAIESLTTGDDGAHWELEVIEAARTLLASNKPLFQRKRSELKKASKESNVTEWTKEVKQTGDAFEDSTKADDLVNMVTENCELFHNAKKECFATFKQNGHFETWSLGSGGFKDYLGYLAYKELGFSPSDATINQSIIALKGVATYDGKQLEVFLRCAPCQDGYIIDLGNESWQAVKVTPNGWQVVDTPETKFIRSNTAQGLPIPDGANINLLWNHINIENDDRALLLAFMLESWRPDTAYIILMLSGWQGSAKSTSHKRIRQLSDPNAIPLRTAPKTVQDAFVSAANNHQASFENMSNLSKAMQDAICTISTGGGEAGRKLYSDCDESVIEVKRPVILNGIECVLTRADAIDRAVVLNLPKIEKRDRKRDAELDAAFEQDAPAIFAGLLNLFSKTLNELPRVKIPEPQRMADFTYLGEAMCAAYDNLETENILLLPKNVQSFNQLYDANRGDSLVNALDSSPAALAVIEMMHDRKFEWIGMLKELKTELENSYHQDGEGWPKSAKGLGGILRRMSPAMNEVGVGIEFLRRKNNGGRVRVFLFRDFIESKNNVHEVHTYTKNAENSQNCTNFGQKGVGVHVVHIDSGLKKTPKNKCSPKNEHEVII
jgi:hypothetical protein